MKLLIILSLITFSCAHKKPPRRPASNSCANIILDAQAQTINALRSGRIGHEQANSIFQMQSLAMQSCFPSERPEVSYCQRQRTIIIQARAQTQLALREARISRDAARRVEEMQDNASDTIDRFCE